MELHNDFSDLLCAFNEAAVNYLIVGGHAVAVHDVPRFTKGLDIWIEPAAENAARAYRALADFGAAMGDLTVEDLVDEDVVFQLGVEPVRVDILNSISGVEFGEAWPQRIEAHYGDVPVNVIGRAALIANKLATARPQDLVDVENLRKGQ